MTTGQSFGLTDGKIRQTDGTRARTRDRHRNSNRCRTSGSTMARARGRGKTTMSWRARIDGSTKVQTIADAKANARTWR